MAQVKLRTDGGADLQSALIVNAVVGTGLPEDFSANQHSYLAYYRHTAAQNANNLPDGWHDMKAYVTNCATTSNHGTFIQNSYGGTPFQMWIPDANDYIYKRYSTTGFTGGEGWKKLSAGYADSAPWTGISGRPTKVSSFTNDTGYITGITKATVTAALGYTPPTTNTTYNNATSGAAGLMSATDKSKLDSVASGANNYSLPTAATGTLGGVKVGANITIDSSGVISPTKTGVTAALGYTPLSTTGKAASAGSADSVTWTGVTNRPTNVSSFTNDAGYITGITKATVTAALGYTPPTTNTTYSAATTTYAGLVKVGNNISIDSSGVISPTKTGVTAALGYTPLSTTGKAASAGSADSAPWTGVSGRPTNVSSFTNDAGYATEAWVTSGLNGKSNTGHTHTKAQITDFPTIPTKTSQLTNDSGYNKEAYLEWGGRSLAGTYAPIDASMVPELGANRLAFGNPNGITVEYSRNNGATWMPYGLDDNAKKSLFTELGSMVLIGKNTATQTDTSIYQARVTIDTDVFGLYTVLNKFVILVSTNGSSGCWCSIDASLESTPATWVNFANKVTISGWSGYNVINTSGITTYGNSPSSQYGLIRFTFGCTGHSGLQYLGLTISKILGFGGVGWNTPSTMAKYGRIFTYDADQNVNFPAKIKSNNTEVSLVGHNHDDRYITGVTKATVTAALNYTPLSTTGKAASAGSADSAGSVPWTGVTGRPTNVSSFTNDAGYITGITKATVTAALGYTPPTTNTTYSNATTAAAGLMSAADKTKLDGVASGANNYSLPTAATGTLGGVKVGTNLSINASGVLSAVDTTYSAATTAAAGLMSATDKVKLNGIATGANNYSLPTAATGTLGGIKVGTNLSINASGVLSATDTTYSAATTAAAGLMSAADKIKLNGIASGANNYSLPTAATGTLGGIKVGTNLSINASGVLSATDTTYANATTAAAGLMSATDKTKLDGVDTELGKKVSLSGSKTQVITANTNNTTVLAMQAGPAPTTGANLAAAYIDYRNSAGTSLGKIGVNGSGPNYINASGTLSLISLNGHTHDNRYYTKTESDNKYLLRSNGYANGLTLSGATFEGRDDSFMDVTVEANGSDEDAIINFYTSGESIVNATKLAENGVLLSGKYASKTHNHTLSATYTSGTKTLTLSVSAT